MENPTPPSASPVRRGSDPAPLPVVKSADPVVSAARFGFVAIMEFRGQEIASTKYLDKQDKKTVLEFKRLSVACELVGPSRPVLVEIIPPRGEEPALVPFSKGDIVIAHVVELAEEKGVLRARVSHFERYAVA